METLKNYTSVILLCKKLVRAVNNGTFGNGNYGMTLIKCSGFTHSDSIIEVYL